MPVNALQNDDLQTSLKGANKFEHCASKIRNSVSICNSLLILIVQACMNSVEDEGRPDLQGSLLYFIKTMILEVPGKSKQNAWCVSFFWTECGDM